MFDLLMLMLAVTAIALVVVGVLLTFAAIVVAARSEYVIKDEE